MFEEDLEELEDSFEEEEIENAFEDEFGDEFRPKRSSSFKKSISDSATEGEGY